MKHKSLSDGDHLLRHVRKNRLRRDENQKAIGFRAEAFHLRDNEKFLSATWLEYFGKSRQQNVVEAVRLTRTFLNVSAQDGYAIGAVGAIKKTCAEFEIRIRVLHEPEECNPAHVAVRQLPRDNIELLELLAAEAWAELVEDAAIPR